MAESDFGCANLDVDSTSRRKHFDTPAHKKFIELPPILVLVAIMVGDRLWGIVGVVFVIPLFAIFYDLVRTYLEGRAQS